MQTSNNADYILCKSLSIQAEHRVTETSTSERIVSFFYKFDDDLIIALHSPGIDSWGETKMTI